MVWFYKRSAGDLRIRTQFDPVTDEYVFELAWPGRPPVTERLKGTVAFERRVLALERELERDQPQQAASPETLPSGWRGPIAH